MHKPNWDIFCKVVDNFGDIGVCWRLAQQLHTSHGIQIRLWVDDLHVAKQLLPLLNTSLATQVLDGIEVMHWHPYADFAEAAPVVIEAFSCELPAAYMATMQKQDSKWINLDYLSAEAWVEDFHAKPSPQHNGLVRYFYYPGFTENTGGLLGLGTQGESKTIVSQPSATLKLSLFCYPHAPITSLFNALAAGDTSVHCYVPHTSIVKSVESYFGCDTLRVGQVVQSGMLSVEILPFLSQADYDALLKHCDVNFVRGEDSWVRAIWAQQPFVWQPYWQEENTHVQKLDAFLNQFYTQASTEVFSSVKALHHEWANGNLYSEVWQHYLSRLASVKSLTKSASEALKNQPDLASKLVIFCNKL